MQIKALLYVSTPLKPLTATGAAHNEIFLARFHLVGSETLTAARTYRGKEKQWPFHALIHKGEIIFSLNF